MDKSASARLVVVRREDQQQHLQRFHPQAAANMAVFKATVCIIAIALIIGAAQAAGNGRKKQPTTTESSDGGGDSTSDQCPEPYGFFADAEQCDKYYECKDGAINEKLCPDGMVFNDYSSEYEKCDLPFNIDCSSRPKLQVPDPSQHCPRKHGYFAHEEANICDKFYYCVDGKFNMITCPNGLVYNEKVGICSWPEESKKKGCSSEEVFPFHCPKVDELVGLTHPRYADPDDCQFFYVCINGVTARRNGCKLGQVFDDTRKTCEWARRVPECKDWYKGQLTDEQLDALENPPTRKPKPVASSGTSRRRPQKRPAARQEEADD